MFEFMDKIAKSVRKNDDNSKPALTLHNIYLSEELLADRDRDDNDRDMRGVWGTMYVREQEGILGWNHGLKSVNLINSSTCCTGVGPIDRDYSLILGIAYL